MSQPFSIFPEASLKEYSLILPIEGGIFDMGARTDDKAAQNWEKPIHQVKIASFFFGKYPVTQAFWERVMSTNPASFKGQNRPVENVSWNDIVQDFLPKLNQMTEGKRPKDTFYRLPTEAEWEFAAKGGLHQNDYVYAGGNKLDEVAWFDDNSHNDNIPVGLKLANTLGFHDMSGNVWEWCHDWFSYDYYEQCKAKGLVENPTGPRTGSFRVLRGGSWVNNSQDCRTSYRIINRPDDRNIIIGLRLVCSSLSV